MATGPAPNKQIYYFNVPSQEKSDWKFGACH